jgi:hypothetical protein
LLLKNLNIFDRFIVILKMDTWYLIKMLNGYMINAKLE